MRDITYPQASCITNIGPDAFGETIEPLDRYIQGGFHPIHLGDELGPSGNYRVIHKLGHGAFGVVWLCRDTHHGSGGPRYVALKVMAADQTESSIGSLTLIKTLDQSAPGSEHIAYPIDHFLITGPNGTHHCIVLPFLGPQVSSRDWWNMQEDPGPMFRSMAYQATEALNFLHSQRISHGAFRPSNILIKLAGDTDIDTLYEGELFSLLGHPRIAHVPTGPGFSLAVSSPRYLVASTDLNALGNEYLSNQICVVDSGASYRIPMPPQEIYTACEYLAPEILLGFFNLKHESYGKSEVVSRVTENDASCDLWALGCTLYEIRKQTKLFYMTLDGDQRSLLGKYIVYAGGSPPPPPAWWAEWENRDLFLDDEGYWILSPHSDPDELEMELSYPTYAFHLENKTPIMTIPEAEQALMSDLLHKLLHWEPKQRLGAEAVMAHGWFKAVRDVKE